jgi:putative transposase
MAQGRSKFPCAFLRSDNGPEFVSRAIPRWLASSNIDTAFIDPGKPWQNPPNESFNAKFHDECLSLEWFGSRAEAKVWSCPASMDGFGLRT